ncbi:MAG TPA: CHASE2 domain-containing protein, partial [Candidatus Methylomirabilis sp.]|nr:CHASE2 domain-containing protein [Candidatus Methylomirabilis sp.]
LTGPSRHSIAPTILAGIVLTLIGGAVAVWSPPLADSIEGRIYDSFLRSAPRPPAPGPIAIVDLDEESLERFGQWPWPRYRIARLLDSIREGGAKAVGLDMVFAEPDRTSLTPLSGEILRDLGTRIDLSGFPREALDTDRALAATLAGGPFVLGYQFDFETRRGEACVLHPLRAAVLAAGGKEGAEGLFDAQGVVCNLPILSTAAGSSGFFNVTPDPDGVLRRVPLVIRHKGMLYPALALAVYLRARGGDAVLETGTEGVEALRLDGKRIPLDRNGNLLLNFRGRHRTFPHLSAAAVLEGTANPALLKGRIVLLGTTAAGLKEIRTTPLDAAMPGVEIHATVLDNLFSGDPITVPRWARVLRVLLVLVPGFLLTGLLARSSAAWGLALILPSATGIWLGSWWLLAHRQIFLPPLLPVVTLTVVFTVLTSLRFLRADREVRERTRKLALTQDAIIQSLAGLTETRHHETGGHIQRTRHYIRVLAGRLQSHPGFRNRLDDATVDLLFRLAPLHDIGKVGVRDRILLKAGLLTPEEYEEMKRHTLYGSETIQLAKRMMGEDAFFQIAEDLVLNHHERWDGAGYPRRLREEEIPLAGRLMAVADAYDAIISPRVYKPALSHQEAVRIMSNKRGTHFDPDVVDAFLEVHEEFRKIAARFTGVVVEPELPPET